MADQIYQTKIRRSCETKTEQRAIIVIEDMNTPCCGPSLRIRYFIRPPVVHLHLALSINSHPNSGQENQLVSLWVVMEGQQQHQHFRSRVVKVNSERSWKALISQAKEQGYPVFIHFGASWGVPSLAMNAFFEELAMTYPDILFLSVDVDEAKEVASKMGVKAMPTFVLMRDENSVIDKAVGANPEEIRERVDNFVQSFRSSKILEGNQK